MSAKYFCDSCNAELTEANRVPRDEDIFRLSGRKASLAFQVTAGSAKGPANIVTWNAGDFCRYCIIDAVNSLGDRARSQP
jgi:hypothetical protein